MRRRHRMGVRPAALAATWLSLAWAGLAPAQETARSTVPIPSPSSAGPEPVRDPAVGYSGILREIPEPVAVPDSVPVSVPVPPPIFDPANPPRVVMGPFDVIHESIFGAASKDDWKPLTLRDFFTEGWDTPYTNAPEGLNGAPKQNWIGTPAGVFGRFFTLDGFYTNHLNNVAGLFLSPNAPFMPVHTFTTGNQYTGFATLLIPLNARMELQLGTAFITSNKTNPNGHYVGNWGDTGVQARFHLIEQRDFSLVGLVGERIPTGKAVNGNGINYVTPGLEFWWNFAPSWVVRGGSSINILTGRKSSTTVYVNQLSAGRYLTGKDATYLKELEVHLTVQALSDVSGGAGHVNDIYLFPGFRFGLDKREKWYALGGVQIPVSGPQAYAFQPQFSLTRNY